MKNKIIWLLLILIFFCCKEKDTTQENEFIGLGNLTLGSKFNNLKDKEHFSLDSDLKVVTYDSVYCIAKYEINKEFGIVENLNIAVKNGNIFLVNFKSGPYTNNSKIQYFFDTNLILEEKEEGSIFSGDDYYSKYRDIKGYIGCDKEACLYSYMDDSIWLNIQDENESFYKNEEKKREVQRKKEYMKDMPNTSR